MQLKRINRNYTYYSELKFHVVTFYLNGEYSKSIYEKLNIQRFNTIYMWTKAYQDKGKLAIIDGRARKMIHRTS